MDRKRILQLLAQHKSRLTQQYGVSRLALFGSTARDAAGSDSDVDVLVAPSMARLHPSATSVCSSTWRTCWAVPLI